MSSTNVRQDDIQAVGGQVIAKTREQEIVVPPKASGRGPSRWEVKQEEIGVEIPVMESELHQDGTLVSKDGTKVAKYHKNAYKMIKDKQNKVTVKKVANKEKYR